MKRLLLLYTILCICSCETVIDLDVEAHESIMVIHCLADNTLESPEVCVGYSAGYLDDDQPGILMENVDILIRKNGQEVETFFSSLVPDGCHDEDTGFKFDEIGALYELEVTHPDYQSIYARQIMPSIPGISAATYEQAGTYDPFKDTRYDKLKVTFEDDAATEDYYWIQGFIRNRCCEEDFYSLWTWSDNFLLEETVASQGLVFNDGTFNGEEVVLDLKLDDTYIELDNHLIYVRFSKITRDAYLNFKTRKAYQDAENNPFAEPVTIHSNIENGFGIFGLEAVNLYQVTN